MKRTAMCTLSFSYRLHEDDMHAFSFRSIWIHFRERFQIAAVSPKTLSKRLTVDGSQ